jgi:hypothetical protein
VEKFNGFAIVKAYKANEKRSSSSSMSVQRPKIDSLSLLLKVYSDAKGKSQENLFENQKLVNE